MRVCVQKVHAGLPPALGFALEYWGQFGWAFTIIIFNCVCIYFSKNNKEATKSYSVSLIDLKLKCETLGKEKEANVLPT